MSGRGKPGKVKQINQGYLSIARKITTMIRGYLVMKRQQAEVDRADSQARCN